MLERCALKHKLTSSLFFSHPSTFTLKKLFLVEAGDAGKLFALEEFKGSAAAGGDVGHLVAEAEIVDSRSGIAGNRRRR